MVNQTELDDVQDHLYMRADDHLSELDSMLKIQSIPNDPKFEQQNKQIINRLAERLTELEFDVELVEIKAKEDQATHYVIFASYFSTPAKNVMLIYGHVDVPPVGEMDPWLHPPFQLTEVKGMLYGRGLTSSKGPILCWIQAIDAWFSKTGDLPVNIKIIIDSDKSSGTQTLRDLIGSRKDFFRSVDLLVGRTNLWIAEKVPMLTTSHSGYVYFELEVKANRGRKSKDSDIEANCGCKPDRDPMAELCLLMNTLTDTKKGLLVEGLKRHVLPVTQHDWDIFCKAEVGVQEYKEITGAQGIPHERSQPEFLKNRWCMPSLSFHSVVQSHTVSHRDFNMPTQIVARFSVKLVPDQSIKYASFVVRDHLDQAYIRLKCKHRAYLRVVDQLSPLNEARNAPFNLAACRAYESVYNVRAAIPATVNVCMPIMNELRRYCMSNVQVVGLPFCSVHVQPNQVNESFTKDEYLKNLELFTTFLFEVALVPSECKCTEIPDFCFEKGKSTDTDFIRMMEPRPHNTHVLYEIDEKEIDRTKPVDDALPNVKNILLGKDKADDTL
ncbi:beta-Ala-His dipeptidase-like [Drosophila innubila]|uniref:beta-Ala-His dipeptidase-like n=1 Tax=Drosophila innubila TaxID=198719 RepID=UPI00148B3954|nr:beta-Ala-His dipeptidase-like [Drosophila innubila]